MMSGRHVMGAGPAHQASRRMSVGRKTRVTIVAAHGSSPGVVGALQATRARKLVDRIPEAPRHYTGAGLSGLLRDDGLTFVITLQALARRCRAPIHRVSGSDDLSAAEASERSEPSDVGQRDSLFRAPRARQRNRIKPCRASARGAG